MPLSTISTNRAVTYAGAVLQVVNANYGTYTTSATTAYVDSGLSASITPTSLSSKVLVLVSLNGAGKSNGAAGNALQARIVRDSTGILVFESVLCYTNTAIENHATVSSCYLDSPATSSSVTYKVQFRSAFGTSLVFVNNYANLNGETRSTITLMEIAA